MNNKHLLRNKFVLFDTNFLTEAGKATKTGHFDDLFSIFVEQQCIPVINKYIEFEFLRGAKIPQHIELIQSQLRPVMQLLRNNHPDKQASLVDECIKFDGKLYHQEEINKTS